MNWQIPNS